MMPVQERTIILLACSHDKRSGSTRFDRSIRRLASPQYLPNLSESLLAWRHSVAELLKGNGGRLYDPEAGFRDLRRQNRALVAGPDLRGTDSGTPSYMPTFRRYDGRFFVKLEKVAPDFWSELPQHPVEILFVSGLYGLLVWDELIQEYDCNMGDFLGGADSGQTLAKFWNPHLTGVLCDFIISEGKQGRPVKHVFDLLPDELYQSAFAWERIHSLPGVRFHHRAFRPIAGTDTLPYIAQILATQLPRFYEGSNALFEDGEWFPCPIQGGQTVQFRFEPMIRTDLEKARAVLLYEHPSLESLPDELLRELALAEDFWQKGRRLWKNDDLGVFAVAFAKCFEHWLCVVEPSWNPRDPGKKPPYKVVLDAFKRNGLKHHENLGGDVKELWTIRHDAAHAGQKATLTRANRERSLVLKVLSEGARLKT